MKGSREEGNGMAFAIRKITMRFGQYVKGTHAGREQGAYTQRNQGLISVKPFGEVA